jgi:flavin-dependent dehydrogenase
VSADVVIIGGGPAGSAAAIELAKAGRDVLLLEREPRPKHKVCGEFLSHEALRSLKALDVDASRLGAVSINSVRLADAKRTTRANLPFVAQSLSRCLLDEALLDRAASAGTNVMRGTRVLDVQRNGQRWHVDVDDVGRIEASEVFVATGKYDLPGQPRPAGRQQNFLGFKLHFRLAASQISALAEYIELMLFRGGYAGLSCIENGIANLGWIVHRDELKRAGGVDRVLAAMQQECPLLAERLRGAEPLLSKPLAISPVPYGYVRRPTDDGLWWLGDQAAVIPSFTGDGMSIALHSGRLAAAMYLRGKDAKHYQQTLADQLQRQVAIATSLSRGLVWPPTRALMLSATRLWPGSLTLAARMTRIAESAQI